VELGYSSSDEAFRDEVRTFLRENLPDDLARRARREPCRPPAAASRLAASTASSPPVS
jgi:hypothetical protein